MQDILKHLPAVLYEYVIIPDGARYFSFISETCESILGLSSQTVKQDAQVLESIVYRDDLQNFRESTLQSERTVKEWNWEGRFWVRGKLKWMEFNCNHELKNDGTIVRRGVIQDITARKNRADDGCQSAGNILHPPGGQTIA